jgi:hypothetical protein
VCFCFLLHFGVSAGHEYLFFVNSDSFSATGKWVATSNDPRDKIATPQEIQIDCFKGSECIAAEAEYFSGNPHVSIEYLRIDRWDRNGIQATSSSGICMTDTISINFVDHKISILYSPKTLPKEKRDACSEFGGGR